MPTDPVITVQTAHGERRFGATAYHVDDEKTLTVLNGDDEVAQFMAGEWTGVHHPPVGTDPLVTGGS